MTKFDMAKAVLPMKWSSPGCTMVTLKSKILLYMSTPDPFAASSAFLMTYKEFELNQYDVFISFLVKPFCCCDQSIEAVSCAFSSM